MTKIEHWYDTRSLATQILILFAVHAAAFTAMMLGVGAALSTHGGGM